MVSWKEESVYPSMILQYDLPVHSIGRTLHVCVIVKSKTDFVVSGNQKEMGSKYPPPLYFKPLIVRKTLTYVPKCIIGTNIIKLP